MFQVYKINQNGKTEKGLLWGSYINRMGTGDENSRSLQVIIAITDHKEDQFEFKEYTPEEFMKFSTIPPFKIFFNVNLTGEAKRAKRKTAVSLTAEKLETLIEYYEKKKNN